MYVLVGVCWLRALQLANWLLHVGGGYRTALYCSVLDSVWIKGHLVRECWRAKRSAVKHAACVLTAATAHAAATTAAAAACPCCRVCRRAGDPDSRF